MIGCLTGTIIERSADFILLDVGGVGYQVHCSERTLAGLPADGSVVRLYTDLQVREDSMQLFGFPTKKERELHNLLNSVQGVGAKAALAIAGALGVDGAVQAVTLGDSDAVRTAKGVGPKLASRIVRELQEPISALVAWSEEDTDLTASEAGGGKPAAKPAESKTNKSSDAAAAAEAHSGLVNLGYQHGEASRAVAEAVRDHPQATTEQLIRQALLRLVPA